MRPFLCSLWLKHGRCCKVTCLDKHTKFTAVYFLLSYNSYGATKLHDDRHFVFWKLSKKKNWNEAQHI